MNKRRPRGPVPVYQLVFNAVKADIDAGRLKPGQSLPTEAEMCEAHNASRQTVRRALADLREAGLIYTIRAEGSYVGPPDAPKIREPLAFERIADAIIEGIRKGTYKPDEVLPSESVMIEEFGAAKKTVRAAVNLLREQGWAYTVPAIGTFVASRDKWPEPR
ncbi:winged helix-turn-helix transcriptional regulator [Nonomuraea sp. NN258]|uniref:GntR family transcriptional regulator n=1 Tax=Nonomuraea antri TaxID=2730852 RepID=UPI0015680978|nr:winged helix-turn-helix domain-containing protein [Nonomuraea antri]NRQ31343.1 winged helix-turn-helix transcriptional regulator [Nonomuraea antri]